MTIPHAHAAVHGRRAFLAGSAALALTACAGGGAGWAQGLRLVRTQAVLERFMSAGRLPGAAVGVRLADGGTAFAQAGRIDFGAFPSMDRDTLFRIYSMTKPVTGTAAALLIEDGRLALDQPVADFIPEFADLTVAIDPARGLEARRAERAMTVRHLLTHTSGLTYTIVGDGPVQRAYRRAGIFPFSGDFGTGPDDAPRVRDLDEMVARLAEIPLIAEPGTAYNYGVSLDVLGLVIERAAGVPFADFLQNRLFDPLGMSDTLWHLRPGDAGRLAQIYAFGRDTTGPGVVPPGVSADVLATPVTLHAGGAGLISTTRDYLAFLAALLDDGRGPSGRIMRAETARLTRSDILPEGLTAVGGGYGFGGWLARPGHRRQGEFGWSGAAGTQGWIDPERGFAGVMMIQAMPYGAIDLIDRVRPAIDADLGIVRTA